MTAPLNTQTRASDRPIEDANHDDFQRNPFALRIAKTLIERKSPESIVVGLYGKWGEGKSSVINLIKKVLTASSGKVVYMVFNPWRFPNEDQLIKYFFTQLAQEIERAIPLLQNNPSQQQDNWYSKISDWGDKRTTKTLQTRTETIAELFSTYTKPFTGLVNIDVSGVIESHLPDLEKLRERIEAKIKASGKRIVVIIDDVDRLEKKQIQAIFRLVKLTADFQQTAYLLALDDVMVARAIGEMFESGEEDGAKAGAERAGYSFLEKIIQVPLRLPRARPDDLLQFCWNRLQEALNDAGITLLESEQERLGDALRFGVLSQLTTPRLAVRYANAVQFGLPLLHGEVNPVDQILVEAMHIFYPRLHHYVTTHEHIFAGSTDESIFYVLAGESKSQQERHQQLVEIGLQSYQGEERQGAISLLSTLFPRIVKLYQEGMPLFGRREKPSKDELTRRQSVAASSHFARYFAYAVVRGDVSDQEFGDFLAQTVSAQIATASDLLARLGPSAFLLKIQARYPILTSDQATSLWHVLVELSSSFDGSQMSYLGMMPTQLVAAAKLMIGLLEKVEAEAERYQLVINLLTTDGTFDLAKEIAQLLRLSHQRQTQSAGLEEPDFEDDLILQSSSRPKSLFSMEQWQQLIAALPEFMLTRALKEAVDIPLYKSHPFDARNLFRTWIACNCQPELQTYVLKYLADNPKDVHSLLAAYSSQIGGRGDAYLANLSNNGVGELKELFGQELFNKAKDLLAGEIVTKYPGRDPDQPSEQDRLRQFVYLYERLPTNT
jgi:hypothetical protein